MEIYSKKSDQQYGLHCKKYNWQETRMADSQKKALWRDKMWKIRQLTNNKDIPARKIISINNNNQKKGCSREDHSKK